MNQLAVGGKTAKRQSQVAQYFLEQHFGKWLLKANY